MKIGLQMFSIKDHLKIDAKGTMAQVAKLGYKYLEPFGTPDETGETSYGFGMNYEDTKAFLEANGIGLAGAHYYYLGNPYFEPFCEYYAKLGAKQVGSGGAHFPGGRQDVLEKCELMNKDAEIAKKYGLRYYYHNHYREYQPYDGEMVIDIILNNTDPSLVSYELDTFWAARGGVDPVEEIERLKDRIILLHQKDFSKDAGEPLNIWEETLDINVPVSREIDAPTRRLELYAEVGTGILPIQDYIDAGNKIGVEYMLLEQDKTRMGEMESIAKSMEAFKKFTGVEWE
jgi:sugar phosphate isomerase/epimerase